MDEIITVQWGNEEQTIAIVNGIYNVPDDPLNADRQAIVEWVQAGNTIDPYVPPTPPTNDELIDMAGPVMVAFIKAYAQREGVTLQQIRDAIVAQM